MPPFCCIRWCRWMSFRKVFNFFIGHSRSLLQALNVLTRFLIAIVPPTIHPFLPLSLSLSAAILLIILSDILIIGILLLLLAKIIGVVVEVIVVVAVIHSIARL